MLKLRIVKYLKSDIKNIRIIRKIRNKSSYCDLCNLKLKSKRSMHQGFNYVLYCDWGIISSEI